MSNFEPRRYVLQGELPTEDWVAVLHLIGRIGITATPFVETPSELDLPPIEEVALPTELPYSLDEISSRDQYLAEEHFKEYWGVYLRQRRAHKLPPVSRSQIMERGLSCMLSPRPRSAQGTDFSAKQSLRYGASIGLSFVRPRTLAGFPAVKAGPSVYRDKDSDTLIQVGTFLDFVERMKLSPPEDGPIGINKPQVELFSALSDQLLVQIDAAQQQV